MDCMDEHAFMQASLCICMVYMDRMDEHTLMQAGFESLVTSVCFDIQQNSLLFDKIGS